MFILIGIFLVIIATLLAIATIQHEKFKNLDRMYCAQIDKNTELECRIVDLQCSEESIDCTPIIDFEKMKAFSIEREPNTGKVIIGYFLGDKVKEWAFYGLNNEQYGDLIGSYRSYLLGKE